MTRFGPPCPVCESRVSLIRLYFMAWPLDFGCRVCKARLSIGRFTTVASLVGVALMFTGMSFGFSTRGPRVASTARRAVVAAGLGAVVTRTRRRDAVRRALCALLAFVIFVGPAIQPCAAAVDAARDLGLEPVITAREPSGFRSAPQEEFSGEARSLSPRRGAGSRAKEDVLARYYDPESGRFTSRDPIGVWGDSGQNGNGYGAFGNNGVNSTDPFGLDQRVYLANGRTYAGKMTNETHTGYDLVTTTGTVHIEMDDITRQEFVSTGIGASAPGESGPAATVQLGPIGLYNQGDKIGSFTTSASVTVDANKNFSGAEATLTANVTGLSVGVPISGTTNLPFVSTFSSNNYTVSGSLDARSSVDYNMNFQAHVDSSLTVTGVVPFVSVNVHGLDVSVQLENTNRLTVTVTGTADIPGPLGWLTSGVSIYAYSSKDVTVEEPASIALDSVGLIFDAMRQIDATVNPFWSKPTTSCPAK